MIGIIGFNDATLPVIDAAKRIGHEVFIVVPMEKTEDLITFYPGPKLNETVFGYPNVEARNVEFQVIGGTHTEWEMRYHDLCTVGMFPYQGIAPVALAVDIWGQLARHLNGMDIYGWDPNTPIVDAVPKNLIEAMDAIINTHDRSLFCEQDHHSFNQRQVYMSKTKGPRVPADHVRYNAFPEVSWAVSSHINGRQVTIWQEPPPYDDIEAINLPVSMACDCDDDWAGGIQLAHIGSWATYNPISMTGVYDAVSEFLVSKVHVPWEVQENFPTPEEAREQQEGKS